MILLGGGGHSKEIVADYLSQGNKLKNLAVYDSINTALQSFYTALDAIHITNEDYLSDYLNNNRDVPCYLAVGDSNAREQLYCLVKKHLAKCTNYISSTCELSTSSILEDGLNLMSKTYIGPNTRIKRGALINTAAHVHHDSEIGEFCQIAPGAKVLGGCTIGNNVLLGSNAVVLPGVSICDNVKIGALTVVNKPITKPGTYVGVIPRKVN